MIPERQEAVDELLRRCFPVRGRPESGASPSHRAAPPDLIARASRARNGARFARLFAGKWEGEYGSQSEADLALCSMLAFWTKKDAARVDALFRDSGLFRPKWDERHFGDGRTYGQETVAKAISLTKETLGSRRPAPDHEREGWHDQLICGVDKDGERKPKAVVANALLVLRRHSSWKGCVGWDEFGQRVVLRQRPPYESGEPHVAPREWGDEDDIQTAAWMQSELGLLVNSEIARQAVATVAHEHPFHPVRDYLSGLTWDGRPRLDEWLSAYLGASDSLYVRAIGARWLISGVARVFQPGAKADHVLVLEGAQAIGKSTALRTLGGEWFTDELDALGSKDAAAQLHGVWIIELAELDALGRSEISRTKAFISKSFDRYRPPYGKHAVRYERQCVFAGTVNHQDYLKDETGNRRFWPVRCKAVTANGLVDIPALRRDRDQLWAEAVVRFLKGDPWWLEGRTLIQQAQAEQEQRYLVDVWEPLVAQSVSQKESVSVGEVLEDLGVEIPKQGQAEQNRIARCLKHLGWTRRQRREGGYQTWRYFPPSPVPSSSPLDFEDGGDDQLRSSSAPPPLQPVSPVEGELRETGGIEEGVVVTGDIWGAAGDSGDTGDGPFRDGPPPTPAHLCFCCGGREFFPVPLGEPVCVRCHPPAFLEVKK